MKRFPLFLTLNKKPVLVVGGGEIAERKIKLILKADAKVEVIANEFSDDLNNLIKKNKLKRIQGKLVISELKKDYCLIIAATDNKVINKQLYRFAKKNNIFINVVDEPDLCTCTFGSIVDRGDLVVSISSGGSAPVFARQLREKIETYLPFNTSEIIKFSSEMRNKVIKTFNQFNKRRIFWETFFERISNYKSVNPKSLRKEFLSLLRKTKSKDTGEVYLVGAGPGDPDLLTIRALHLMQKSDICIYDNLVSKGILELVRRDSEMVYAGKLRSNHTIEQSEINSLLIKYAKSGKRVLRLKGGDPFIFGRGGEEISELMQHKIKFQVVPGITSASGAASYAGIPLTHRDFSQSCVFLTGHEKEGNLNIDWKGLASNNQTIVIYMGLNSLEKITSSFIQNGMKKNMPAAIIENGTSYQQRVISSTIQNIYKKADKEKIKSPAIIIIGEVVRLRKKIKWFT
jgi:uroporphyrin-III C-methyltransferase/precorrin-2 dehydrogenase/sirohydrochlorin ferrochelatase